MTSLYKAFGTVKEYETEGVTLDFGVAKFKVRRAGGSNRRFLNVLAAKLKPHRRALDAGVLADEVASALHMEVYFETVVLGWEGVTDENGTPLAYNLENFKKVMTDLPDLWATIRNEADNLKNFQAAETATDGETLGKS
jgi:hypothetical protein